MLEDLLKLRIFQDDKYLKRILKLWHSYNPPSSSPTPMLVDSEWHHQFLLELGTYQNYLEKFSLLDAVNQKDLDYFNQKIAENSS